jgi:pyruvate ferredoxin oxidoreductase delta subunit
MIKRVEINYRGVFQKTLARRIGGDLVLIARRLDKVGFSNGRYSDSPERNGLPSKYFAFLSADLSEQELEAECGGKLDIDTADVSIVLDDSILRGVEPWAWHGVRPANEKVGDGASLIVVTHRTSPELAGLLETRPFAYRIAVLEGETSLSGMWVFRDDLTHERVLGAIAAVDPEVVTIDAVEQHLLGRPNGAKRAEAARIGYVAALASVRDVASTEGQTWPHAIPDLPAWQEFREAATVSAVPRRSSPGPQGQARNPNFARGTSRTERPVIRFDRCTKCTLCWLECPDGAFDPTSDGLYDVDLAYCSGCGKCAEVCPVKDCIVMVDELAFADSASPWLAYQADRGAYVRSAEDAIAARGPRRPYVSGRDEPVGSSTR